MGRRHNMISYHIIVTYAVLMQLKHRLTHFLVFLLLHCSWLSPFSHRVAFFFSTWLLPPSHLSHFSLTLSLPRIKRPVIHHRVWAESSPCFTSVCRLLVFQPSRAGNQSPNPWMQKPSKSVRCRYKGEKARYAHREKGRKSEGGGPDREARAELNKHFLDWIQIKGPQKLSNSISLGCNLKWKSVVLIRD